MPLALQATVSLVHALQDPNLSSYTRRLTLSMSLMRLVNGLTDRMQPRGDEAHARSVYSLAEQLSLPPSLVDLRHQASHNALPQLPALISAASSALLWLEQEYWNAQKFSIENMPPMAPRLDDFAAVFGDKANDEDHRYRYCFGTTSWKIGPDGKKRKKNASVHAKDLKKADEDPLEEMRRVLQFWDKEAAQFAKRRPATVVTGNSTRVGGNKHFKRKWKDCGFEQIWQRLPIGLAPGQTQVATPFRERPADKLVQKPDERVKHKREDKPEDKHDDKHEENATGDTAQKQAENTQAPSTGPCGRKKRRRLKKQEAMYIKQKQKEFSQQGPPPEPPLAVQKEQGGGQQDGEDEDEDEP